ncbi:Sodium/hydrogen exchanger family-domain-containing protein [Penicillium cosmopolitanum]|uniref:Sodium/hydrogen exchanger family-domain-containing protein n=1 Tax=Penicillium cosmopolitanum TaxID=1131564 RepID=A0A9W9SI91_9EURO|nr:Sodium/hydrogen exchanger family-domain-containing protein [Penicillium cosmopolitanum]KAJ5376723.1 Sodium/hydrogen exchanger family-domain-containing protein [Penicillium cosmopolitanum]
MAGASAEAAFAYHEPPITTILNQTGFLIVLNVVNVCLDKLLYCGLIGQLFVGILWGTPGAKWLDRETETVIQQLGYLGLIMLVYEGGLSTSIKAVKSNLLVSLCVAVTGIGVPMGLSFILRELVGASSLQAFAAGAALSATSLGTTFTILSTTNLIATRLGTVTTSAAMLDDVVGLVMVQIISNLGGNGSSFDAITVIRPVFVSIGFAVGLFLLCAFFVGPCLKKALRVKLRLPSLMRTMQFAFLYQTLVLVGIVAAATYAGTSSLFAAYLAGVVVTWFDSTITDFKGANSAGQDNAQISPESASHAAGTSSLSAHEQHGGSSTEVSSARCDEMPTGEIVYERYYKQPVTRILTPLFFASIGFAIPITEMFRGSVVWRGLIYSLLMMFGKMVTGLWLVRFSFNPMSKLVNYIKDFVRRSRLFCTPKKPNKEQKRRHETPSSSAAVTSHDRSGENADTPPNAAVHRSPSNRERLLISPGPGKMKAHSRINAPLLRSQKSPNHYIRHLFLPWLWLLEEKSDI